MALQYLGLKITVDEFISYLDKSQIIFKNGVLYASDPRKYFIDSQYNSHSYGLPQKIKIS